MTKDIYFNHKLHKYTDLQNNVYKSVTTVLHDLCPQFDTKKMAKLVSKKGEGIYKGMKAHEVAALWKEGSARASLQGNEEHNLLELAVKGSTGATVSSGNYVKLKTIDDVLADPESYNFQVDLDDLYNRVHSRHHTIVTSINYIYNKGFLPFSELCVYDSTSLIAGLVDLPFIHIHNKEVLIGDYKTNKAEIRFEAGYFKKDSNGNLTDRFIETGEKFFAPISHVPASTGYKYALQLSMYAKFFEQRGFKVKGLVLFHIKRNDDQSNEWINDDNSQVKTLPMPYMSDEVDSILRHRYIEVKNLFK